MSKSKTVTNFTSCEVSGDGSRIRLAYCDGSGSAQQLDISVEQAGSLAMTLPRLLSAALKARNHDSSLRFVFPLSEFNLEATAGSADRILSLRTPDGFEVSFSISQETLAHIGHLIELGAGSANHEVMH